MANDWRELAERLSGSRSSTNSANTSTSSNVKPSSSGGSSGASGGSSNDWRSLADELSGSRKQAYSDYSNSVAQRVITRAKKKEEEDKKWYEKGHFEDGWDFGDVTKTLLGIKPEEKDKSSWGKVTGGTTDDPFDIATFTNNSGRTYGDSVPGLTLDEVKAKIDSTEDLGEIKKWTDVYNQKYFIENAKLFSETPMDGTNHSVLEEMNIISQMEKGEEKDKRKEAVLKKMEQLGVDTADYAIYSGDKNFDWGNFGKWIKNASMAGLNVFNVGVSTTLDATIGSILKGVGWENNPISSMREYYDQSYENYRYNADLFAQKLGGNYGFASEAVEGTAAAIPTALLAIMTGGTSLTASSSSLATNAAYQTGSVLTKAGITTETMMKNPQFWTSFAQTLGTKYEEAKNKGVNDYVAAVGSVLSSMVASGIEIGVDGGSGIQGLPSDLIEEGGSKFWKLIESSFEEGGEEGLQKLVDEGVSKFVYGLADDYLNPLEYGKDMALGTIAGFALGSGQVAMQSTVDAIQEHKANSLTKNEQAVVDKVVADRVAEAEKNGTKLTGSEKRKITETVKEDLEKGLIPVDSIVEALGGEKYNQYKQAADWESSLQTEYDTLSKEYDDLYNMEGGKKSSKMTDREAELKEMLPGLKTRLDNVLATSTVGQQKAQLTKDIYEMSKSDRLVESFFENVRANQKFEADLSKYEGRARDVIKQVMDSGLADNSNQSHEFWDMIANMAVDRDTNVSLVDNDQMMELVKKDIEASGKTFDASKFEGKIIDGIITEDGIAINAKTKRALNFVVGHEITHSLEQNKSYGDLQKILFKYAQDDYKTRFEQRAGQYEDIYSEDDYKAKIDREVTADMVGDFIFTDKDFIKHLSTEDRSVFQKMWDEVKYLSKVATAGSKQARELEKVKKTFAQVWRENATAQKNTADGGVKYGISKTSKMDFNDQLGLIEKGKMNGSNSLYVGKPSDSLKSVGFSDAPFAMNQSDYRKSRREAGNNKHYSSHAVPYEFFEKLPQNLSDAPMFIDNVAKVSVITPYGMKDTKGNNSFVIAGVWKNQQMESDTVNLVKSTYPLDDIAVRIQRAAEEGKLVITNKNKAEEMLATIGIQPAEVSHILSLAKETLSQQQENVKFSLSDSNGRELSKEQSVYFRDSKVRDENGSLLPVYHGSKNSGFNVFQYSKDIQTGTDYGEAYYFTSDRQKASGYSYDVNKDERVAQYQTEREALKKRFLETRSKADADAFLNYRYEGKKLHELIDDETYLTEGGEVKEVYLNLKNPLIADAGGKYYYEVYHEYFDKARKNGNDGIIVKNVIDNPRGEARRIDTYIAFKPEQIKAVTNQNPTDNPDIRKSISDVGQAHKRYGRWNVYAKDILLDKSDIAPTVEKSSDVAPVAEKATQQQETQLTEENSTLAPVTAEDMSALFPNDAVPVQEELEQLVTERDQLFSALEIAVDRGSASDVGKLAEEYEALNTRIKALESTEAARTGSITDADVPAEMEAPLHMKSENYNPYQGVTLDEITRSTRTYSDMNPGARQYIEEAALGFLYDVNNSTHGERWYNDDLYYSTGGEQGFGGTARSTTDDIAYLKDSYGYTWEQLQKAAEDVVKGEVRSAAAKRVEYLIHNRLMEGYTDVDGRRYEPNQNYITFLNEQFANETRAEGFDSLMEDADQYAPYEAPVKTLKEATADTMDAPIFESKEKNTVKGQTTMFEPEKPKVSGRVANVLAKESKTKKKPGIVMPAVSALVDKGMVFENYSLKTGNHEVQAKWNSALPANTEKKAQYFMENGADGVKPLKNIREAIKKTGKEKDFSDYMYHVHNIDRMSLEERFGLPNKPVFGDTVTAEVSRKKVQQYEKANPEFKTIAEDIYSNNRYLRNLLVENGVISQETADLWEKEYPHFVPIRRVDQEGRNISVPLDTNKTGVNAPVKMATGGSSDIEPLLNTMAMRTEQVFSAIARNSFGIELKNSLGTTIDAQQNNYSVDEAIDLIEDHENSLLKPGTLHSNPTFTVFENGERVEFEITEDMYDAMKPAGKLLGYRNNAITKVSNWRRNLLTTWNPVFALWRNPVKDLQDVMINSQHAAKTYAQMVMPTKDNVIYQIATHGKWAAEYESNGGKGSTYFDGKNNKFNEDTLLKKIIGFPLNRLEAAGEFIEEIPRLAEYIASRKDGRSVDRSMLDAARVTTNFAAGGDVTKLANAHGFTFLNASVQGASQHVRNFREATKQDGMKGFVKTLAKYTLAGIPGIILNNMVWGDDEEYEELNDYVKQNYYVVAKTEDGKFIRIPKGRTAAVMQNALEQMQHLITGDGEADFSTFYELFMNNIAPNNPVENNILAPIGQVKNNKAWYGDDLVPTRLQDLPTAEQYDESTDALSKWLGENFDPFNIGPYKINYLLDQYSGGLGDMILPMMTPEAESGDNTLVGNMLAPWKKEITTDSVLNNKNPGNFYDLKDKLNVVSNGKNATEEDRMRKVYMDSVSWDMGDLYAQKREIQNSNLPDDQKYEQVREIQAQINELANNALDKYNNVRINGAYSEVGDRRFNYDAKKEKWYEITPKNEDGTDNWYYVQEQLSHDKLGMSYDEFWNGKNPPKNFAGKTYYAEYNGKRYDYSEYNKQWYEIEGEYLEKEQDAIKRYEITPEDYWNNTDLYYWADRYFDDKYAYNDREFIAKTVFGGKRFAPYAAELSQIRGEDKDGDGKTDSGSKKNNVIDYINGSDLDYGERIILYRTMYSSKSDKRTYNQQIIDYLNERDDISYAEMKSILEELDMVVDEKGYITW